MTSPSAPSVGREPTRWERVGIVAGVIALVGAVATIVLPAYPPGDAAAHLFAVIVNLHPERFAGFYEPNTPLMGMAFVQIAIPLARVVSLEVACQIVMLAGLVVHALAMWRLSRRLDTDRGMALAIGAIGFVGWRYAMGFFAFSLATAFGALAWDAWLGRREGRLPGWLAAGLFLLAGWAHPIGGAMILANVVLVDLLAGWRRTWRPSDLAIVLPAAVWIVGTTAIGLSTFSEIGRIDAVGSTWLPLSEAIWAAFQTGLSGFSPLGGIVAALGFVVAAWTAFGADDAPGTPTNRACARASLLWLAAFFVLPFHAAGWHYASARVLYLCSALAMIGVVGRGQRPRFGFAIALSAAIAIGAGIPAAVSEAVRIEHAVAGYDGAPIGNAYAVTYQPEPEAWTAPWLQPFGGAAFYAATGGGALPGAFASSPALHSIRFVGDFPPTRTMLFAVPADCLAHPACAARDVERADRVAADAVTFDSVVLAGAPSTFVARLEARGFVRRSAGILEPRPGTLRIGVARPPGEIGQQLFVRAGYPESVGAFRGGRIDMAGPDRGPVFFDLAPLPAGPIMLQIFVDADDDGAFGDGDVDVVAPTPFDIPAGRILELDVAQDGSVSVLGVSSPEPG